MVSYSKRHAAQAASATIRFSTFLPWINRLPKFPAPKKISTAIAEKHSGGCWRFCRACCSLANMTKARKSKTAKQKHSRSAAKPRAKNNAAKNTASPRGGTADPTNPKRVAAILTKLDEAYPNATCELKHENPFQLVISTILSAQCTDVRVNQVAETLYKKYPDPKAFAYADPSELEQDIRPTGFFRK